MLLPIANCQGYQTNLWLSDCRHTHSFTSGDFLGLRCMKRYTTHLSVVYLYNDGRNPHVCYHPRCRRPGFSLVVWPAYRMYAIQDIPDLHPDVKHHPVSREDMTRSPARVWGTSRRCYSSEAGNKRIRMVFKGLDEYVKQEANTNTTLRRPCPRIRACVRCG